MTAGWVPAAMVAGVVGVNWPVEEMVYMEMEFCWLLET
jgi:hypothetical protein